ncbi:MULTISPECIES: D-alanyl-D-alanine endopeptidase PBP7/8 [unclassified Acinetobacter]|uniref:D-alanyl-D-alanine endopeptidase PBP7/8 n=1 Tax=unclassified Acinetobacter TaxID=196816 RepID=UPI00244B8C63|nr:MULTISPECIES: D-alanyl-D-alanine endopeptidase PBP7/8 [unclassified Acinetobacter]MDH0031695.1 D-alanyl-D-alanine endopeptidase PBP7/8 [Acinetobacter sp. GD04021]MDH0887460.1 D-alanyl-D-alanine endopeptidase PBP7/8 [Acinetobacter sp. GD03873]MDH1083801.1 D-alanyl-D-alanine endopeptidase PBP7/8 [Acinetobacter sp. GD03983]MDH2190776.1 D-alanyl-D-alanine endopeptidase PBP7/8 [Acinetobacter sp. GD03645]MDH2204328.1 D-alanyl-D-alanine endopeptidase PBP7/8 [Acinetobacter sp. GD03647]
MKNSKKSVMHVLGMSILLAWSSTSFAELVVNNSPVASSTNGSASLNWSANDASQLMEEDEPLEISPQGSTSVTTTLRSGGSATITSSGSPKNTVQIRDTFSNSSNYSSQPSVNARAALVMDAQTGEVLYSKNSNMSVPIASITKLMTAVVTADARLNMSEEITLESIDFAGAGGKNSSSTLRVGDTMNRAEALLFALMKSENPAAAALARTYPGGRPAFIAAMNAKAKQLGMSSTRYAESTGLDPHNVSSARDLGILVSAASQYGLIRQFSTTPTYDFNLGYRVLKSNNTNALVRNGGWNINLSKTGYINEAGRCVVMHTTVNSRPAVVVLLGASSSQARTNDATNLLNWVATLPKRI